METRTDARAVLFKPQVILLFIFLILLSVYLFFTDGFLIICKARQVSCPGRKCSEMWLNEEKDVCAVLSVSPVLCRLHCPDGVVNIFAFPGPIIVGMPEIAEIASTILSVTVLSPPCRGVAEWGVKPKILGVGGGLGVRGGGRAGIDWSDDDAHQASSGSRASNDARHDIDAREEAVKGINRIDLSRVSRVDTGGLALLLHLIDLAKKQGNSVTLQGVNDKVYTLAKLYNLPADVLLLHLLLFTRRQLAHLA